MLKSPPPDPARHQNSALARSNLAQIAEAARALKTAPLEQQRIKLENTLINPVERLARVTPPTEPSLLARFSRLESIEPSGPQGAAAKSLGLQALNASDAAHREGDAEAHQFFETIGTAMADITIGFVPVVGVARDFYEAGVGRNLLTNDLLASEERALAVLGILSGGFATTAARAGRLVSKIAASSEDVAKAVTRAEAISDALSRSGFNVGESAGALKKSVRLEAGSDATTIISDVRGEILERAEALGVGLKNRRIRFADDNNARDLAVNPNWKFSYRQGSLEVSGLTTKASDGFVRVFDSTVPGAMERPWVVHKSTIQGLTPNEIKQALKVPSRSW
jgi:hypothetical protein